MFVQEKNKKLVLIHLLFQLFFPKKMSDSNHASPTMVVESSSPSMHLGGGPHQNIENISTSLHKIAQAK